MAGNLSLSIDVPRYLFRVFSPGSDGMNDATGFASMAKSNNNFETRSLAQLERPDARNMLKDHVLWQSWRSRSDDLLISFTSSFLFALQHCVRKIATGRDTTRHNCHISIIDTSMFPEGTFTWTVELLKEYHLDEMEHPYLLQMYHEAEYLAQYQLAVIPDAGVTVSFEELVTKGDLFQIAPELEDKAYEKLLWRRLQQLRASWYREEEGITSKHVERALNLALCFGGQWVPLVMMWALATRMRSEHDQILRHQFRDPLHGHITAPFLFANPETVVSTSLPELREWQKLMSIAYVSQQPDSTKEGAAALAQARVDGIDDVSDLLAATRLGPSQ